MYSSIDELREAVRGYIGSGKYPLGSWYWIGMMGDIDSCSDDDIISFARNFGLI